jgi:hypothetical protein
MRHCYEMEETVQPLFNHRILLVTFGLGILFMASLQGLHPPNPKIDICYLVG